MTDQNALLNGLNLFFYKDDVPTSMTFMRSCGDMPIQRNQEIFQICNAELRFPCPKRKKKHFK